MGALKGVFAVMPAVFDAHFQIDETGYRANINWYIDQGVHGVVCNGSTGEFVSLTEQERQRIIDITMDQVRGRVSVIAGAATNTTMGTVKMAEYAKNAGVDCLLIVPPYYGLPNQEEIYQHYKEITESVEIPIMLYNNPGFSGVDLLPPLVERLARLPNIQYIKESSGDIKRVQDIIHGCRNQIDVWCGWESLALTCFLLGCQGWISPVANFMPRQAVELFNRVQNNEIEAAKALFLEMLPLLNYVEEGQLTAKVKQALSLIGRAGGVPRRPFLPIGQEALETLKRRLQECGLPLK